MKKRDRASFFFPPFLFATPLASSLRERPQRPPQSHARSVATE
ncbi:hypothetical protein [Enterobacter asburiae]